MIGNFAGFADPDLLGAPRHKHADIATYRLNVKSGGWMKARYSVTANSSGHEIQLLHIN